MTLLSYLIHVSRRIIERMNKILNSIRFVPQEGDKQEFLCYLIMLVSQKYEKKMNERRKEKKNSLC